MIKRRQKFSLSCASDRRVGVNSHKRGNGKFSGIIKFFRCVNGTSQFLSRGLSDLKIRVLFFIIIRNVVFWGLIKVTLFQSN